MPQGTIKSFDIETRSGTLLLDTKEELHFDAETVAASGLEELRVGQRVRFELTGQGDQRQLSDLQIVSL